LTDVDIGNAPHVLVRLLRTVEVGVLRNNNVEMLTNANFGSGRKNRRGDEVSNRSLAD
jgi:hypothetical protein